MVKKNKYPKVPKLPPKNLITAMKHLGDGLVKQKK